MAVIKKSDGDKYEEVQDKSNAFTARSESTSDKQSVMLCYKCGKHSHMKKECRQRRTYTARGQ
ncbi:hypothetical protein K0M31_012568 [Melipona bicolor]|uniref:CCHC-type domain-containing protein n=1 Tax=Melipona bicolor TaxID=60889 RepID=A0AA40KH63_9HYME|nr:hypothetical protein K0M31_012568 [Melipona bicolor]